MGGNNTGSFGRTRTIARSESSQIRSDDAAKPMPELRAGDRIGRYIVEEVIGVGGMGMVVAASDPELERSVALKLVRRDAGDHAFRERLVREARAMARIEHENVVRIYDAGEHDGEVFIAMELVRGETVGAWLRSAPRSWRDVLARFEAAGRGLAAAHRAGLVHRDFKPDNILVRDSDGRVCVGDFGLVRPIAEAAPETPRANASTDPGLPDASDGDPQDAGNALTRAGAAIGTPPYMAPEQTRGDAIDARADVFGFCVSLYEGLYGERPFDADDGNWARAIATGRYRRPPPGRRVPAALRRALRRGLAIDPDDRWSSVDALLAALALVRRRRRFALAAAVLVGLAACLAVALMRPDQPIPPPAGYLDGMALLHLDDFRGAAAAFARAVAERPDFAPAWLALAQARKSVPDLAGAKAAIARAAELVAPGDRAHRLEVDGLAAELAEQRDAAIEHYQAYFRFFPDDVDAGIALAELQAAVGHASAALVTLQGIPRSADDGRLALAEARATTQLGKWPETKAAADRAIALGRQRGAPGIIVRALQRRGQALEQLGDHTAAMVDLNEAAAAAQQIGDRSQQVAQLHTLAAVLYHAGDIAGSARAADAAIPILREIGEPHSLASGLLSAATIHGELSEPDLAMQKYAETLTLLRGLDDRVKLAAALLDYGEQLTDLGRRVEADKVLRESIDLCRATGQGRVLVIGLAALAWNNFGLGIAEQAESEWREAGTIAERDGYPMTVAASYDGAAMVLAARGDHAGALRSMEQAVHIAESLDPTTLAAERAWYAIYLGEAGQYSRAAELAVPAAEALRDDKMRRDEMLARAAAAFALAQLGRRAEALTQLELGRALLAQQLPFDQRGRAATLLLRAAQRLDARDQQRAIYAAAPHDRVALPWATELAALAKQLHL